MRTKEQLEKDKLHSKNLNRVMHETRTQSENNPDITFHVCRQGNEYTWYTGDIVETIQDIGRFHASWLLNGHIIDEGY